MAVGIELRLLGALEVVGPAGAPVPVRGLGARLLLALAVDRGAVVADHDLLERLWSAEPPNQAIASVRNQVARLRRTLGAAVVERTSRGYRLNPDACRFDVDTLADTVATARTLDPARAAEHVDRALAHVRGRPFDEVADEVWAMPAVAAAAELVANAEELWADAVIAAGRAGDDIARLRHAATTQPHRELRWRHLVTALAGAGRRTEGLRAVGEARRALAEFGLLPGADLRELERSLVGASDEAPLIARIPIRRDPMVGREVELASLLQPVPVIWIDGEPGSGKTRLLAELADRQMGGRDLLLYAACPHVLGSGAQVLSSFVATASEASADIGAPADELAMWRDHEPTEPVTRRATLVGGLVAWLRTAAAQRSITAVIDDAHWLDDDTIAVLMDVIGRTCDVVRWVVASRAIERHPPAARMRDELERAGPVCSVSLGALTVDDVYDLIDLLVPTLDEAGRDALANEVMASTGGHALSVAEMIGHRQRLPDGDPPRLDAIVRETVRSLRPAERELVELLAVAGGPCPVVVLAATCGLDAATVLELAERVEGEGLLAPVAVDTLDLRHDLIRRAVARQLSPAAQVGLRRRLVRQLAHDERFVTAAAHQMLQCGDLLEADLIERRDQAVADAIDVLMRQAEYAAARALAERYLSISGREGAHARRATLRAATALIATGDVGNGRATLVQLIEHARVSDDQVLLADAVLAMGPLMLGKRERGGVIRDAERLTDTLPASEGRRRVQLACWAAHHRVNRGEGVAATYLLQRAEDASVTAPELRGLILAVRTQAATLIGSGPGAVRRSLDELLSYVRSTRDLSAEAASLLLCSRQAWVEGTVADVADVRDAIAKVATRMPRPDLQWWPLAVDAAIELATGRGEAAAVAIEHAERTGRQLGVEVAGSTALAQQLLLLFVNGEWAVAADSFQGLVSVPDASPSLLAAVGLACAEVGRLDVVSDISARLADDPQLLVRAGMTWPQVAVGASAVAVVAEDATLAERLWRALEPYSGTGLALPGAGYFGAVDRCLGLLAATLGDRQRAIELLSSARDQEQRRGATLWETRAAADLSRVRAARRVRAAG